MEDHTSKSYSTFYLIGNPVAHSISPQIFNALFEHFHLPYNYTKMLVTSQKLPDILNTFKKQGIIGFNVTIPLKNTIMDYLDEISPIAKKIGAVNSVKIQNGRTIGTNTDIQGIQNSFEQAGYVHQVNQQVVLVGSGGAAYAAASYLSNYTTTLSIINRTLENAENLRRNMVSHPENKVKITCYPLHCPQEESILESADLIINATPIGMWPQSDYDPIDGYIPKQNQWVFDMVYNPIETKLLRKSKLNGAKTISGLDMLIYQAAEAFRWWIDWVPNIELMKHVAVQNLSIISSE
ncbi:MAG: shikimate dehydrogenase [Candidatus Lokiarchaeota archaeon]|nr:shikimate dehydrogenase [Candidatus Lokiarchaeota archaeon]